MDNPYSGLADRVIIDPAFHAGAAHIIVRGARIVVSTVLDALAASMIGSAALFLADLPTEDVRACLTFGAWSICEIENRQPQAVRAALKSCFPIPAHEVVAQLASNATPDSLLNRHPDMTRDDIAVCLAYASKLSTERSTEAANAVRWVAREIMLTRVARTLRHLGFSHAKPGSPDRYPTPTVVCLNPAKSLLVEGQRLAIIAQAEGWQADAHIFYKIGDADGFLLLIFRDGSH